MADHGWTLTNDRAAWADAVLEPLSGDPIGNTVVLSVAAITATTRRAPVPGDCYGWWTDASGDVRAAFASMRPNALALSAGSPVAALAELPGAWLDSGRERPAGVSGPLEPARRLCEAWSGLLGIDYRAQPGHEMRLFSFDEPAAPDPAPAGEARVATIDDLQLSFRWEVEFAEQCDVPAPADTVPAQLRLEQRRQFLWIDGGVPVATAWHTPVVAGASRIIGVYTPDENRRRGYAAGVTWATVHDAIAQGAEHVVLHTDLANPTSNGVYRRLGFRPVHDVTEFEFID